MRTSAPAFLLLLALARSTPGDELSIRFAQGNYTGQPFTPVALQVELDAAIPAGLFSYGVALMYDPSLGRVVDVNSIMVPPELDFDGVRGASALKALGNGFAAVKGTVDFFAAPAKYYSGTALVTFAFLPERVGDFTLTLGPYNTLGPSESLFVTGAGITLDANLSFGSTTLHVIPEQTSFSYLIWGSLAFLLGRPLLGVSTWARSRRSALTTRGCRP